MDTIAPEGTGRDLLADLSILYDAARGFLGLSDSEAILRHTLLSLLGSCGAGFAAFLDEKEEGVLRTSAARGLPEGKEVGARLSQKSEKILLESGRPMPADRIASLGPDWERLALESGVQVAVPIKQDDRLLGVVVLGGRLLGEAYAEDDLNLLGEIAELTGLALSGVSVSGRAAPRPPRASRETRLDELREQHPALRAIRGESGWVHALFDDLIALADFDLPVLVLGETGTGKELVARALHELSARATGSFEAINCAAIPPDLIASALFGHEKGAFTGAIATLKGAFERAGEGTIFLDEIGDMPLEAQATLLRTLQERNFRRVGGDQTIPMRARILSATNRDLVRDVEAGRFRADLFYRIQTYSLHIPPLRERKSEIPALVSHVLAKHRPLRGTPPSPSPEFLQELARREFPGNVRELEGLVLSSLVRARTSAVLRPEHLITPGTARPGGGWDSGSESPAVGVPEAAGGAAAPTGGGGPRNVPSYDQMEREYISSVLRLTNGNRKQAAALMGIPRTTLNARMKKLEIEVTG